MKNKARRKIKTRFRLRYMILFVLFVVVFLALLLYSPMQNAVCGVLVKLIHVFSHEDEEVLRMLRGKMDFLGNAIWMMVTVLGAVACYFFGLIREKRYGVPVRMIVHLAYGRIFLLAFAGLNLLVVLATTLMLYLGDVKRFYCLCLFSFALQVLLLVLLIRMGNEKTIDKIIERQYLYERRIRLCGRSEKVVNLKKVTSGRETDEDKLTFATQLLIRLILNQTDKLVLISDECHTYEEAIAFYEAIREDAQYLLKYTHDERVKIDPLLTELRGGLQEWRKNEADLDDWRVRVFDCPGFYIAYSAVVHAMFTTKISQKWVAMHLLLQEDSKHHDTLVFLTVLSFFFLLSFESGENAAHLLEEILNEQPLLAKNGNTRWIFSDMRERNENHHQMQSILTVWMSAYIADRTEVIQMAKDLTNLILENTADDGIVQGTSMLRRFLNHE